MPAISTTCGRCGTSRLFKRAPGNIDAYHAARSLTDDMGASSIVAPEIEHRFPARQRAHFFVCPQVYEVEAILLQGFKSIRSFQRMVLGLELQHVTMFRHYDALVAG